MLKKVLKASPSYIVPSFLGLLALMLYTRTMDAEEFGKYSLLIVTIELFQSIFFQWIKLSLIRFYHNEEWDRKDLMKTALISNVLVTMVVIFVIILLSISIDDIYTIHVYLVGTLVIIRGWGYFYAEYYRVSGDTLNKFIIHSIISSIFFIVPGLLVVFFVPKVGLLEILALNAVLSIIYLCIIYITTHKTFNEGLFKKEILVEIFKYGGPLVIVVIATSVGTRIDRILIESLIGLKELAYYAAAYSIANMILGSVIMILTIPTYPQIMKLIGQGDLNEAKRIYRNNGELMLFLCLPLIVLGVWESEEICNILLGKEIAIETSKVLPYVLLFSLLYNLKTHFIDQSLQFARKTKYTLIVAVPACLLQFVLGWLLIRDIGIAGMAISGVVVYAISITATYLFTKNHFEIIISWTKGVKILFLSILAALVVANVEIDFQREVDLLLKIILFVIFYTSAILIAGKSSTYLTILAKRKS